MRHPRTVLALLAVVLPAVPAHAEAPERLTVSNASGDAVQLVSRGDCWDVFDATEATGEPSLCGPGAWPEPGGEWGPVLEAAGGSKLVVRAASPIEGAELAATTNFPLGLTTPDGRPVLNETLAGPLEGEATGEDGRSLTFELPRLDPRAARRLAVALVVRHEDSERHFAFALRTPASPAAKAPKAPPPLPPAPAPTLAPGLTPRPPDLGARAALRRGRLVVRFFAHHPGRIRLSALGRKTRWVTPKVGRWQRATLPLSTDQDRVGVRLTQRTRAGLVSRTGAVLVTPPSG